jgi:hypothetical protein
MPTPFLVVKRRSGLLRLHTAEHQIRLNQAQAGRFNLVTTSKYNLPQSTGTTKIGLHCYAADRVQHKRI